jgi:hypothetical protein
MRGWPRAMHAGLPDEIKAPEAHRRGAVGRRPGRVEPSDVLRSPFDPTGALERSVS